MTPFEAVYGRPPPTIIDYIAGASRVAAVEDVLTKRTRIMEQLRTNLAKAQQRMKSQADQHRTPVEFAVGDLVYLKLQPYRQHSVTRQGSPKLAKRYYGPYRILERIGKVAYRVELPANAKVHNVFHISLLKKCHGNQQQATPTWPIDLDSIHPSHQPQHIIGLRHVLKGAKQVTQVLVQWDHQLETDATWEDLTTIKESYPNFNLEDEVNFDGEGNVSTMKDHTQALGRGARQRFPSCKYPSSEYAA
ncbi:unnamed protein product [Rhodiola kirilowii]